MLNTSATVDDPRPQPPERPAPEDCCGSGCDQCVFALYEDALDRYRAEVAALEGRRALTADHDAAMQIRATETAMDVDPMDALVDAAAQAQLSAYAPYSHFRVGAAVRASDGRVFTGCNVENASYGLSICAERVAIFDAVAHGVRDIVAVAVVSDAPEPASPCGACRQVIAEFAHDARIVLANASGARKTTTLGTLLPDAFRLDRA